MKFDASFTSVGVNLMTGLSSMMIKNTQQRKSYWIHLDEKCFYVTSRGDNIKNLPLGGHKAAVSKEHLFLKWYRVASL